MDNTNLDGLNTLGQLLSALAGKTWAGQVTKGAENLIMPQSENLTTPYAQQVMQNKMGMGANVTLEDLGGIDYEAIARRVSEKEATDLATKELKEGRSTREELIQHGKDANQQIMQQLAPPVATPAIDANTQQAIGGQPSAVNKLDPANKALLDAIMQNVNTAKTPRKRSWLEDFFAPTDEQGRMKPGGLLGLLGITNPEYAAEYQKAQGKIPLQPNELGTVAQQAQRIGGIEPIQPEQEAVRDANYKAKIYEAQLKAENDNNERIKSLMDNNVKMMEQESKTRSPVQAMTVGGGTPAYNILRKANAELAKELEKSNTRTQRLIKNPPSLKKATDSMEKATEKTQQVMSGKTQGGMPYTINKR